MQIKPSFSVMGNMIFSSFVILFIFSCTSPKKEDPFQKMFDGKTLNGWHVQGGNATYIVRDNAIVG